MVDVHDKRQVARVCLALVSTLVAWSCGASQEKSDGAIDTNAPSSVERSVEADIRNTSTAREALMSAPNTIWGMARKATENGGIHYYGSFFLRPDATIGVSFESSGVRMELLYTEWRDDAIELYYSLQYDADHNDGEGGGVWTPGPIEYYRVEFSTETILQALPVNGGFLDVTVQPTLVSEGDVPSG